MKTSMRIEENDHTTAFFSAFLSIRRRRSENKKQNRKRGR